MNCPTCGAEFNVQQRYATLAICAYCESAIVLDEKVARMAGKLAALAPSDGPLYVGGSGRVRDLRFTVLGRVRYGYAAGFWDEWYLLFEDQTTGWVSEDERNYTLETLAEPSVEDLAHDAVQPGDPLTIAGTRFHVDERDVAECEGGEGQLPFVVVQGQQVPFLDCSAGQRFATVEFDEYGPRVFVGERVAANDIQMDTPAPRGGGSESLAAERAGDERRRERIVRTGRRVAAVKCWSCAASLPVPEAPASSTTCESCGNTVAIAPHTADCPGCSAQIPIFGEGLAQHVTCPQCENHVDVSSARPSLLAALVPHARPVVPVKIGQPFRYRGTEYRVTGHIRFVQREGREEYVSDEFLLFAPEVGYRYLILENGHFSFCHELDERPMSLNPRKAGVKQKFNFDGREWQVFERCHEAFRIHWVEGELPWVARVDDVSSYLDAISPPYLLSAEWTESEMEYYEAEYIEPAEAAAALGIERARLPARRGVAPHQPFHTSRFGWQAGMIMATFAGLALMLASGSCAKRGAKIAEFHVAPSDYREEFLTPAFTTTQANAFCAADFYSALNQAWLYLDVAVINDRDEAVLDFSSEMSAYSGSDSEGSWTENASSESKLFKLEEPGTYRLLLLGQSGRSTAGDTDVDDASAGGPLTICIREGAAYAGYYLGFGAASAIAAVAAIGFQIVRRGRFEAERWDEGEDD